MENKLSACNPALAAALLLISIFLLPGASQAQCPPIISAPVTCISPDRVSLVLEFGTQGTEPPCSLPYPLTITYSDANNPTPATLDLIADNDCGTILYEGDISCTPGEINLTVVLGIGANTCTYVNLMLPVELSYFRALPGEGKKALLLWETASEENSDVFQVERSADGMNFQPVAEVKAAGEAHGATAYRYVDESPNAGGNYYRLKMKDLDGSHSYSGVEFLEMGAGSVNALALFPSPAKDYVTIDLREDFREGEVALLEVFTISGQRLLEKQIPLAGQMENLDIRGLKDGYYLVSLRAAGKSGNARLVIQR